MKTTVKKTTWQMKPETLYAIVKDLPMTAILDSSLQDSTENGRYSIIGLYPYLILAEKDGVTYENDEVVKGSFEDRLSLYLATHYEDNETDLPLIAGGIGYFSYDYGRKFEKISSVHLKNVDMPEALFCFYENLIIYDHQEKEYTVTMKGMLCSAEESFRRLDTLITRKSCESADTLDYGALISFDFTREDYQKTVSRMMEHIVEGDIYIANMTQRMMIRSDMEPFTLFWRIRQSNPSPFGGYFHYKDVKIVSASPERFIRMKDRLIETKPIKGTRKRGNTTAEDHALKRELEQSEKDKSELLMIVDLERNDLNRISETGSVKVTKHFEVQSFATVFHLVTTIRAKCKETCDYADLLKAMFPGGSITGAPKIEAMKIIDGLEHSSRGLYTGSLGYISLNGDCDLNIVIRTAVWQDGVYHIGVGGGITAESDPAFEYEETLQKARAFMEIFQNRRFL